MKRMGKKRILCIILLLLMAGFIWGNSMVPGKKSMELSDKVVTDLGGTVTHSAEESRRAPTFLNSSNVRKFAHAIEFAVLGGAAATVVPLNRRRWPSVLLVGLGTAVLDETIQIFTNRTPAIKDVWIDFGGFLCGVAAGWIVLKGMKKLRTDKEKA